MLDQISASAEMSPLSYAITIYHSRIDLPSYESTIALEVLRARATAVASCSGAEADETQ